MNNESNLVLVNFDGDELVLSSLVVQTSTKEDLYEFYLESLKDPQTWIVALVLNKKYFTDFPEDLGFDRFVELLEYAIEREQEGFTQV